MLLSRRVSVLLLGALVLVVMALGITGVLRAVSASPETADKEHGNTLTVLTKTGGIKVVDLGAQGPSHGDMRVFSVTLYNEAERRKSGASTRSAW